MQAFSERTAMWLVVMFVGFCALLSAMQSITVLRPAAPGAEGGPVRGLGATAPTEALRADVQTAYGKLPLSFEANHGQFDPQVLFLARGSGYTLFLTPSEAVLVLPQPAGSPQVPGPRESVQVRGLTGVRARPSATDGLPHQTEVRLQLVGANPVARVMGQDELPGKVNYFIGNDPARWRTDIPTYGKVQYQGVYPGVDLVYYGKQGQVEYDFVVAPGGDPGAIALALIGAESMQLDTRGDVVVQTAGGELRLHQPRIYQEIDGVRQMIASRYVLRAPSSGEELTANKVRGTYQLGFQVAAYDARRPVVIDPVISYVTHLGGHLHDTGHSLAVDAAGHAYVTGWTHSRNFPVTPGAFQSRHGGGIQNAFVTKVDPTGSALVYSTYFGGHFIDQGSGIAVDAEGNVYVTGWTNSREFPITPGAFQSTHGGGFRDAFVTKFNPTGSALVYSTYLGGGLNDEGWAIAVDAAGNSYITGKTASLHFPTTQSAFQRSFGGGDDDAFVTKLNPTGSALVYSTYLGGIFCEFGWGIAVDAAGHAYVTGPTYSANFPTTRRAFQPTFGGHHNAFVTKLNRTGSALVYSTYLGGRDASGRGIAVDAAGHAYVTGTAYSTDFPTTPGAFQPAHAGGFGDAFVTKLNRTGSALVYSTYLGGSGDENSYGIAVDAAGNVSVTGATNSTDFPTTPGAFQRRYAGSTVFSDDAFVTTLNSAGSDLTYSTYLGGSKAESGYGLGVDAAGNVYVVGWAASPDFPTTPGAFQPSSVGGDAFIAKIDVEPAGEPAIALEPPSLNFWTVNIGRSNNKSFRIRNNGAAALHVTNIVNVEPPFALLGPLPPFTVEPGKRVEVKVRFTPIQAGKVSQTLGIQSNAPEALQVEMTLQGRGKRMER